MPTQARPLALHPCLPYSPLQTVTAQPPSLTLQDLKRLLNRRLRHHHRLEATAWRAGVTDDIGCEQGQGNHTLPFVPLCAALHLASLPLPCLCSPLQRRVLLNVLAVLVQRRGPDALQLASRQRRLQNVRSINRTLRSTRADQSVDLGCEKWCGQGHSQESRKAREDFRMLAASMTPSAYPAPIKSWTWM